MKVLLKDVWVNESTSKWSVLLKGFRTTDDSSLLPVVTNLKGFEGNFSPLCCNLSIYNIFTTLLLYEYENMQSNQGHPYSIMQLVVYWHVPWVVKLECSSNK